MTKICLLLSAALCLLPVVGARADENGRRFPSVGPEAEVYLLSSSRARDRFGSTLTGIGLGFGSVAPSKKARLSPDISILKSSHGRNDALFVIAGVQYKRAFSPERAESSGFVPYYGVGLNALYGRVKVPMLRQKDNGFGGGASIFVGSTLGRRAYVEARYRGLSSVGSYNFSGLSLSAGIRF